MNSWPSPLDVRFPQRADVWQLRTRRLAFGNVPLVMGIVNVTPDSFSDGGDYYDPQAAIDRAIKLADEGADILDIGGESTRPYATTVSLEEELRRVIPVVEAVATRVAVPISIDTRKAEVAEAALAVGAEIINDVSAFEHDPQMPALAVESQAGVCLMHMQGTPETMQDNPTYGDLVAEIAEYLQQRRDFLQRSGMDLDRICLDPGIGFGKTHQHNLRLMAHVGELHRLACPLLVGHSRKGFLAKIIGSKQRDRLAATIGSAVSLAVQGVQIIRVHDVRPVREALLAFAATGGVDGVEAKLAE